MLKNYLKKIVEIANRGDAREESYYSTLEGLLVDFAKDTQRKDACVTVLPKKTDAGNPDFRVWDGKIKIIGYIEAKVPEKNLDEVEKTEQFNRYSTTYPNFVLTNFVEFRLYKKGTCISEAKIANLKNIHGSKQRNTQEDNRFMDLLERFFSFSFPSITTTEVLALELAKRTRFLRDEVVAMEMEEEERSGNKKILGFYEAFQTYLIKGLTKEQFADLYSQTLTYGLFAARMRGRGEFNRKTAVYDIPRTLGILRDIFEFISLGDIPEQMAVIIDDISSVLASVDVKGIFSQYFISKKGGDPVFPFYETFLAEYDPAQRERRGVYYTPEPVVSYIIRSCHSILKEKFLLPDGLAEKNVTILDPAGGTLTFLAQAIKEAIKEFSSKYGDGGKGQFIKEHILADFYAFELLIAPYAIGHLKVAFLLEELGYKLTENEKLKFYLTNTLEMEDIKQTSLPGMASLSEESRLAGAVKKNTPILIILGNPPYSGHSENTGKWISDKVKEYYKVDGHPLKEKNSKWLQNDYVKFIRFAQWKIDQTGSGVLAFITSHSYLNSPLFRGMRQSLSKSFDDIYLLNLHGNSSQKERCPDGGKDENVFDIKEGVSIALYVKKSPHSKKAKIRYADLWGLRHYKYDWLIEHDINNTPWEMITPHSPEYLFVPRDESLLQQYKSFCGITDIFKLNTMGIQTHRDNFAVSFDKNNLEERIQAFRDNVTSDETFHESYELKEPDDWKIKEKRSKIREDTVWQSEIVKFHYHPFDRRWIFYSSEIIDRDRWKVMQHMLLIPNNIGLVSMREYAYEVNSYNYALVSDMITNDRIFVSNKGAGYFFPLYLLNSPRKKRNLEIKLSAEKKSNISANLTKQLQLSYKRKIDPEEIFYYVYAVLFSEVYRIKYDEFLKTNFPRIPITSSENLFSEISLLGKELTELHLLKSESLSCPIARFQGAGNNIIEKPSYENNDRVYVNKTQYFEGIKPEVWNYQIGGYQVLFQWLKNRKDRILSLEDIMLYCKIVTSLSNTLQIQGRIDSIYISLEGGILKVENKSVISML